MISRRMLVLLLILFFNFGGYAFPPKSHSPDSDPALPNNQHIHSTTDGSDNAPNTQGLPGIEDSSSALPMIPNAETDESDYQKKNGADAQPNIQHIRPTTDGIDNAPNTQGLPGIEDSSSALPMIPNAETDESDYQKKSGAAGAETASSLEDVTSGQVDVSDEESGTEDDLTNKVYNLLEEAKAAAEEMEQLATDTATMKEQDERRLLEVEADVVKLTSRLQNLTKEETKKRNETTKQQTRVTELKANLDDLKLRIANAGEETQTAVTDFETAKQKLSEATDAKETKQKKLVNETERFEQLIVSKNRLISKVTNLTTAIENLYTQLSSLLNDIDAAFQKKEAAIEALEIDETEENTELKKQKTKAVDEYNRLIKLNETLKGKLQNMTIELNVTETSLRLKREHETTLKAEVDNLDEEIRKAPLFELEQQVALTNRTLISLINTLSASAIAEKEKTWSRANTHLIRLKSQLEDFNNNRTALTGDPLYAERERLRTQIDAADSVILRYKAGAEWARKEVSRLTLLAPPLSTGDRSADSMLPPASSIGDWLSNNWYIILGILGVVILLGLLAAALIVLVVWLVKRKNKQKGLKKPADDQTETLLPVAVQKKKKEEELQEKTQREAKPPKARAAYVGDLPDCNTAIAVSFGRKEHLEKYDATPLPPFKDCKPTITTLALLGESESPEMAKLYAITRGSSDEIKAHIGEEGLRVIEFEINADNDLTQEKTLFRSFLEERYPGTLKKEFSFGPKEVFDFIIGGGRAKNMLTTDLLYYIEKIMEDQKNNMIELEEVSAEYGVFVFGDIHGDLQNLIFHLRKAANGKLSNLDDACLIFTGDYVDRGDHQMEVFLLIFTLRQLSNVRVIILRGNHEHPRVNKDSFRKSLKADFKEDHTVIYDKINSIFAMLPIAATIEDKVFITHAGWDPRWPKDGIHDSLVQVGRSYVEQETSSQNTNTTWADPNTKLRDVSRPKGTYHPNNHRKVGICLEDSDLLEFMNRHGYEMVVRGHQTCSGGFHFNERLNWLTLFSTTDKGCHNSMGIVFFTPILEVIPLTHQYGGKSEPEKNKKKKISMRNCHKGKGKDVTTVADSSSVSEGSSKKKAERKSYEYGKQYGLEGKIMEQGTDYKVKDRQRKNDSAIKKKKTTPVQDAEHEKVEAQKNDDAKTAIDDLNTATPQDEEHEQPDNVNTAIDELPNDPNVNNRPQQEISSAQNATDGTAFNLPVDTARDPEEPSAEHSNTSEEAPSDSISTTLTDQI